MIHPVYTSPIIFSAPMIRALLDSRKSQTRRLITSQWANVKMHHEAGERCLLWVRESFSPRIKPQDATDGQGRVWYATDSGWGDEIKWKTSIHMPRWASRLTLELTDVRLQRLQDISEGDAVAEGTTRKPKVGGWGKQNDGWSMDWPEQEPERGWGDVCLGSARSAFGAFINELHGGKLWNCKPEVPLWDQNPAIIAFTFFVHRQNVDALIGRGAPCAS